MTITTRCSGPRGATSPGLAIGELGSAGERWDASFRTSGRVPRPPCVAREDWTGTYTLAVRRLAADRARAVLIVAAFLGSTAIALYVVRPFAVGPIGPDAAAPVIEFERLLAGQRLEGYLSQTSKPLLTLVYGIGRIATGDWRTVSALAIVSYALLVALAAWLADRLAGLGAASFVAVALALNPELLRDVTFAYGVSWALLACALAGIAVVRERPRFAVAGVALAAGALARPEVLAVTSVAVGSVAVGHVLGRIRGGVGPPRGGWLLGLGLLAIPLLMIHDLALTGDPLFWLNTAQANSAGRDVRGLGAIVAFVARHVLELAPLLPLAAIAMLDLALRRRWTALVLVTAVPLGVSAFFIASGARGTVISSRYLMPIDLGLVFAAGVGLGALDLPRLRWAVGRLSRAVGRPTPPAAWPRPLALIALGALLAVAFAPSWPAARSIRASVVAQRDREANASRAFAALGPAIAPVPAWRGVEPPSVVARPVLIPAVLRAQGIVDLELPLWAGTKLFASMVDPANGLPPPGSILYHDRRADSRNGVWRLVEVDRPTVVGRLLLTPIFVDEDAGIWILRVDAAQG